MQCLAARNWNGWSNMRMCTWERLLHDCQDGGDDDCQRENFPQSFHLLCFGVWLAFRGTTVPGFCFIFPPLPVVIQMQPPPFLWWSAIVSLNTVKPDATDKYKDSCGPCLGVNSGQLEQTHGSFVNLCSALELCWPKETLRHCIIIKVIIIAVCSHSVTLPDHKPHYFSGTCSLWSLSINICFLPNKRLHIVFWG